MFGFKQRKLNTYDEKRIEEAIRDAELKTSGELRVHLDRYCKTDPVFKAQNLFGHLNMHETADRNGVLIYVALEEKRFAIIGDEGIDKAVPDGFWDSTRNVMLDHFKRGEVVEGIVHGVHEAGEQLKAHFPRQDDDKNELSDEISYG